jgi:hypothetical protein
VKDLGDAVPSQMHDWISFFLDLLEEDFETPSTASFSLVTSTTTEMMEWCVRSPGMSIGTIFPNYSLFCAPPPLLQTLGGKGILCKRLANLILVLDGRIHGQGRVGRLGYRMGVSCAGGQSVPLRTVGRSVPVGKLRNRMQYHLF